MHRVLLDVPVCASLAALALVHGSAVAQSGGTPASLTTPDYVGTRIGALEYWDGVPSEETAERVRDTLDFTRALNVFNNSFRGASAYAIRKGLHDAGAEDNDVVIFSDLMDSSSLFLTANADTVYYMAAVDLSKGPMVIEQPPDGLGTINDMWFSWVIDIGSPGPDRGEGGRYLLVPPGHEGPLPDGVSSLPTRRRITSCTPPAPNKGWFTIQRLHSPLEPFFTKAWRLSEIERDW